MVTNPLLGRLDAERCQRTRYALIKIVVDLGERFILWPTSRRADRLASALVVFVEVFRLTDADSSGQFCNARRLDLAMSGPLIPTVDQLTDVLRNLGDVRRKGACVFCQLRPIKIVDCISPLLNCSLVFGDFLRPAIEQADELFKGRQQCHKQLGRSRLQAVPQVEHAILELERVLGVLLGDRCVLFLRLHQGHNRLRALLEEVELIVADAHLLGDKRRLGWVLLEQVGNDARAGKQIGIAVF